MMFFTVHICNQGLIDVIYAKWYVTWNSEEPVKHEKVVHPNKIYECQLCNKFFDNEEKFQKHIIQVHSEKNQSNDFNSNLPTTN
jgi:hypothetical protein